jgi:curved DNA-binding protein CbpA
LRSVPPSPEVTALAAIEEAQGVLRQELEEAISSLDQATHYELLGVDASVEASALQAAYFQRAKRWHPDKLPAALVDLRDGASRVFSKINEAHQVLSDATRRAEYDQRAQLEAEEDEEQKAVRQVLESATAFQKAEIFAKKRDFSRAAELAKQAFEGDPEQAEYGAFYVWAVAQAGKVDKAGLKALLPLLDAAAKSEPQSHRVRFYRGVVLKRLGDEAKALRDFQFVAENDPKNLDAIREIRLHKMRQDDAPGDKSDGIFGKLFKR